MLRDAAINGPLYIGRWAQRSGRNIRLSEAAFKRRDPKREYQIAAAGAAGKFCERAVALMAVVQPVREDNVRIRGDEGHGVESARDLPAEGGELVGLEVVKGDAPAPHGCEKRRGAALRLRSLPSRGAPDEAGYVRSAPDLDRR